MRTTDSNVFYGPPEKHRRLAGLGSVSHGDQTSSSDDSDDGGGEDDSKASPSTGLCSIVLGGNEAVTTVECKLNELFRANAFNVSASGTVGED